MSPILKGFHTMDISFIIVNWNTRQLLLDCLSSISDTALSLWRWP